MEPQHQSEITTYEAILRRATQKQKGAFSLARTYPAFIILLAMLGLSLFIYYNFAQKARTDRQITFEKAVNSVMTRFQIAYNGHLQVANSIRSLYDNLVQVVRDYLLLYATVPTQTYRSILGFMSVQKVTRPQLTEFEYYVQGQGYHDYKVHPDSGKNVFLPIEFIIPEEPNKHLRGLDVSSVEGINHWLQKAIEQGSPIASRIFNFRGNDTLSIFLIYPVFERTLPQRTPRQRREAFKTAVLMEINVPLFFKSALGEGVPTDSLIAFNCYQKEEDGSKTKLFVSLNSKLLEGGFTPLLHQTSEFNFLDKKVFIDFATVPDFESPFQRYLPLMALGVSLLLSFILFGFVLSVLTGRARAIDLAERMTRSQRRIVESTKDIISVLNFEGVLQTINPASVVVLGYEPIELIGKKIDILFAKSKDLEDFYSSITDVKEEITRKVDYLMKSKTGAERWVSWSFTVSPSDGLIYAVGRDITLEKLRELEEHIKVKQTLLAEQISREASEFKSYFMAKFSHQLRNILTTIVGYHQILAEKKYENEEEMQLYLSLAMKETQDLLSTSSDLFDVAAFGQDSSKVLSTVNIVNTMNEALVQFQRKFPSKHIRISFADGSQSATVVSEREELRDAFEKFYTAFIDDAEQLELNVQIIESDIEGVAEIQILATPNEAVEKMIRIHNENINNLIEALRYEDDSILLNMAIFGSMIRILNGQVRFDTLGTEGNFASIILPKKQ
jgi:PAS domain S-box-containing protein